MDIFLFLERSQLNGMNKLFLSLSQASELSNNFIAFLMYNVFIYNLVH